MQTVTDHKYISEVCHNRGCQYLLLQEANASIDAALAELPDAFVRNSGTLAQKIAGLVSFFKAVTDEMHASTITLPDSLNRPLHERIKLLLERADREAALAVVLRRELDKRGGSSDV